MNEILTRNRNLNRGYRKLEVWNKAVELAVYVRNILKGIKTVSLKVKSQIEDSIISVPSNISEGYCRRYIKEYIQHINIALASLGENYTQLYILYASNEIGTDTFNEYDAKHYYVENKLLALNRSLIKKLKDKNGWNEDYKVEDGLKDA